MHISFSGVISPYTYHCPWAHYLRNVKRIRLERKDDLSEEEQSKRMRGIELHDKLSQYLTKKVDSFEYTTDLIEQIRTNSNAHIERQFYFDLDFNELSVKPEQADFLSIRPDAYWIENDCLTLVDWKFANSDFNAAKYYNETEFFLSLLATVHQPLSMATIKIHFPEQDYTLPVKSYSAQAIASLQQRYIMLTDRILNERIHKPIPAKNRCFFCDYRSEDAGGCGACEYSVQ